MMRCTDVDGVLVRSHLGTAAAELEQRDEGEGELEREDHLQNRSEVK